MALQLKNFPSIAAGMLNRFRGTQTKVTDLRVGGVARTLMEAPAAELDQLYQQMFNGLSDAIPISIFNTFNFPALGAQPSNGVVTLALTAQTSSFLISAGTIFTPEGSSATFVSAADVAVAAGNSTASLLLASTATGAAANLAAGQSFTASGVPGFVSATNGAAFSGGADAETPAQRDQRFQAYIQAIARGTLFAVPYGAKTVALSDATGRQIEKCRSAVMVEPYLTDNAQPIALVQLYIHNGVGNTSDALLAQVEKVIYGYTDASGTKVPGWKAAGVPVQYFKAGEQPLNLSGTVTVDPAHDSATVLSTVQASLDAYALSLDLGAVWVFAEAISLAMATPGCTNFVLANHTADYASAPTVKIVPGTTTLTPAST